ncbi:MAG: hypothetical protein ACC645_06295 [Pirellulales bacterium]
MEFPDASDELTRFRAEADELLGVNEAAPPEKPEATKPAASDEEAALPAKKEPDDSTEKL